MNRNPSPDTRLSKKQQKAFAIAQRAARQVVRRRFRVVRLTKDAYVKLSEQENAMARVARDLHALLRLARAWALREYRTLPWRSVLYVVAAIIYFVNPVDLIPDLLGGLGFVDDAAVVGAVVRSLHDELVAFKRWEAEELEGEPGAAHVHPMTQTSAAAA